jgi:hypothetical protein
MATASSEPASVSMRKVRGMGERASTWIQERVRVYIVRTWGAAALRPYMEATVGAARSC